MGALRLFVVLCLLAAPGVGCVSPDGDTNDGQPIAPFGTSGTWSSRAALPSGPRQETGAVAVDGEVYVVGGLGEARVTSAIVEVYSPETDGWRRAPDLPLAGHHPNAVAHEGSVYVLGSLTGGSFTADPRSFRFTPGDEAWTEIEPLPAPFERGGGVAASLAGRLYVVGGVRQGEAVADVHRYDPAADTWDAVPDLPEPRDHLVGGVINGELIVAGGRLGRIASHSPVTWAFDASSSTWTERAPMPTSRAGAAGAVLGGVLFVIGGEGNPTEDNGVFAHVESYDPMADAWSTHAPLSTPRHGMGAAAIEGVLFVPGGAVSQGLTATDVHEAFVP